MRIIIDLPMNHTSDQHEWFQQSRSDPEGPYGDFYVWNDTDDKWPDIRIIFVDTEDSNWAFDEARRQFYFHRFFSHQPDLNFENPAVHEAMFDIVRFWLDLGVDGFRLDAIPYLYESDEGNGEGEPKTHEFIKQAARDGRPRVPGPHHDRRGEPVAARGRGLLRHRGRAGVPHGLRLPGDAAHLLRAALAAGRGAHPGALRDDRHPGGRRLGRLPAQPRRAHARDGERGVPAGDVRLVRLRPADARQHRHPPPPRAPARQLPRRARARPRAALLAAGQPVPLLRRRDRDGRQHLAARPRQLPHADAVDARPQRRLLDAPTRASSSCRSCSRWSSTTTR